MSFRQADVLVACAGVGRFGDIEELTEQDFDLSMSTNVKGTWLWAREVLPAMKKQRYGQIVVVSSMAGLKVLPRFTLYGTTKWATQVEDSLGRSIRARVASDGLQCRVW